MDETKFEVALKSYREPKWGLLGDGLNPADPSGNAMLYEAHATYIFRDMTKAFWYPLHAVINALTVEKRGTIYPGLLNKKPPPATDFQTHDDYIGLTAVTMQRAKAVFKRGDTHGWVFDNNAPSNHFWRALRRLNLEAWHGRFPGLVAHYYISAGLNPGLIHWVAWYASIWWTTRKPGNESGWLMDYLKIRTALKIFPDNWFVKKAAIRLKTQLDKYYMGNIKTVYAVYFGKGHPFAQYSDWPKIERP